MNLVHELLIAVFELLQNRALSSKLRNTACQAATNIYEMFTDITVHIIFKIWQKSAERSKLDPIIDLSHSPFKIDFVKNSINSMRMNSNVSLLCLTEFFAHSFESSPFVEDISEFCHIASLISKEYLSNPAKNRHILIPLYPWMTGLNLRLATSEDQSLKRLSKDLLDLYTKVSESIILYCCKALESVSTTVEPCNGSSRDWKSYFLKMGFFFFA